MVEVPSAEEGAAHSFAPPPPPLVHAPTAATFRLRAHYLVAFSVTSVLSSQHFFPWHIDVGTANYVIAFVFTIAASLSTHICSNAVLRVIPFSGGAFGLARVSLGFYVGFLVASAECLGYIFNSAQAALAFGDILAPLLLPSSSFSSAILHPLLTLLVHALALWIHLGMHVRVWWRCCSVLAALVVASLLLVFLAAAIGTGPPSSSSSSPPPPPSAYTAWLVLPHFGRCFLGPDCLHLCCDDVHQPHITMTRVKSIAFAATTLFAIALLTVLVHLAPPAPTDAAPSLAPLYQRLSPHQSFPSALVSIPATLALVFSWTYSAAAVLRAMAASRLVSRHLRRRQLALARDGIAPVAAAALSTIVCLVAHVVPSLSPIAVSLLCACVTHAAQCAGFLYLRRAFKRLDVHLQSRLNLVHAVFAMVVWFLAALSLLVLQPQSPTTAATAAGLVVAGSGYYYGHARGAQKFSHSERQCLLFAHVILFNKNKSKQNTKRTRRESMSIRNGSLNNVRRKSIATTPPTSSTHSTETESTEMPRRMSRSRRSSAALATNFIVRDGKIIPIAMLPPPAGPSLGGRRRSSSKSIELATLE
ncbi:Aste57867_14756 [Aphanomyces stellatus]|uniref:Aste57867_14756 protein n=1 Tax=Aphanomyces stellatus TaxID=120398 RepID=A0A485L2F9_9STRA|nr:hypothetical protein As57867_014701 [Aphanomyces stellatus]VFT91574.1 Aste57867_14756 [Aphanomyces stellatus]